MVRGETEEVKRGALILTKDATKYVLNKGINLLDKRIYRKRRLSNNTNIQ